MRPVALAECGFGVRGHVRALVRRDMSRRGKAMSCHRTPKRRQARHICRTTTQTKFQPRQGAAYSDDVAPERSLIRFVTAIYKDASPTGFELEFNSC